MVTRPVSSNNATLFNKTANYLTSPTFLKDNGNYSYVVAGAVTASLLFHYFTANDFSWLTYGTEYSLDIAIHLWDGLVKTGHLQSLTEFLGLPYNAQVAYLSTIPSNVIRLLDIYGHAGHSKIPTLLNFIDISNHSTSLLASASGIAQNLLNEPEPAKLKR